RSKRALMDDLLFSLNLLCIRDASRTCVAACDCREQRTIAAAHTQRFKTGNHARERATCGAQGLLGLVPSNAGRRWSMAKDLCVATRILFGDPSSSTMRERTTAPTIAE